MKINSVQDIKDVFNRVSDIYSLIDAIMAQEGVEQGVITLQHEQLQAGKDAEGQTLETLASPQGKVYSLYTIQIKEAKGQLTEKVTLYDTGDFYNSMRLVITEQSYVITAEFRKEDGNIKENFSNEYEILGLQEENLELLRWRIIYPNLANMLRERLGLQ